MTPKQIGAIVLGGLVALGLAFSAGRFSAPAEFRETIVTKTVEVVDQKAIAIAVQQAKAEWKKNEKVNTTTKTVYVDGKVSEKYVYVNRETNSSGSTLKLDMNMTDNSKLTTNTAETKKETEIISSKPRWMVGANANLKWDNLNLTPSSIVWEAHAQVRVIGGLWAGVTTTPQLKLVGVGLNFQF